MIDEIIKWILLPNLPDSDMTILFYAPANSEPVFLGYYDSENDEWLDVHAGTVEGVKAWAQIPQGPESLKVILDSALSNPQSAIANPKSS